MKRMMRVMGRLIVIAMMVVGIMMMASFEARASGEPIVGLSIEQLERLFSIPFTIEDLSSASLRRERKRARH